MTVCVDKTSRVLEAIKMFHHIVSANSNSSTLYHGIDDILHDKIPDYMKDNSSYSDLAKLEEWGFEK